MITAERVKKSYDRHARNYDAGTALQRELADKLVKIVQGDDVGARCSVPLQILDVGCGTGYLTEKIRATGCDISLGMLNCARRRACRYVQSDACGLAFGDSVFDIVVSNAAYQWVRDLKAAFKEVKRVLKPGGRFYLAIFNDNTLWQLQDVCNSIDVAGRNFPDKNKLSSSLTEAGFKIDSIEAFSYEKYYRDLWELLGALKNIGSTSADNKVKSLAWRAILQKANDLYVKRFANENGIQATYEVFIIKAARDVCFKDENA